MLKKNNLGWIFLLSFLSAKLLLASPLYCDSPIKDFGEINEGEKLSHAFTLRNITQKGITVRRVLISCGCITSLNKQFKLEAGEQVKVPIEFNSRGYGGKNIEKDILLLIGDKEKKPALTLTIKAKIKGIPPQERIHITPSEKYIFNDVGKWHQITIRGPANKNIEISVKGPGWLNVKMSKPKEHQALQINQWSLEFSLNRKFNNRIKDEIVITTNLPLFEKLFVPIYVEPKPEISVSPPVFFIRNADPCETYVKELEITLWNDAFNEDTKENDPNKLQSTKRDKSLLKNPRLIPSDKSILPIFIEPSNDCLAVKLLTISHDSSKIKYEISVRDCPSTQLHLRIMAKDMCIRKVPVIISDLSVDRINPESRE